MEGILAILFIIALLAFVVYAAFIPKKIIKIQNSFADHTDEYISVINAVCWIYLVSAFIVAIFGRFAPVLLYPAFLVIQITYCATASQVTNTKYKIAVFCAPFFGLFLAYKHTNASDEKQAIFFILGIIQFLFFIGVLASIALQISSLGSSTSYQYGY